MDKKTLIKTFLRAVTFFLDEEEKLGFLSQENVDSIIIIENMLQEELSKDESKRCFKHSAPAVLTYIPFLDDDSDGEMDVHFSHKKNELQL